MLSCHSSFVDRHDEPREALPINFHLFTLSMIPTKLFGGEPGLIIFAKGKAERLDHHGEIFLK
jgi:hypothetical protein